MSHYLVTGGAGFIGSHLVEALVAQGDKVRVLDNLTTGTLDNLASVIDTIEFIEGDIQDTTLLKKVMQDIDFVYHLVAIVSVPISVQNPAKVVTTNTIGTLKLLEAAKAAQVQRLIFSSTCAVYGDDLNLPRTEKIPPDPQSPYGMSKLHSEDYCRFFNEALNLETVILRFFNAFGPRQLPSSDYAGVISIFAHRMLQGLAPTIYGDGEQTRDFVFVKDIVRASLLAMHAKEAAGKVINIAPGCPVTINHLFEQLCTILACDLKPNYEPARVGDVLHSYADPALAQELLGWTPQYSFEAGLRSLIDSIKSA